MTMFFRRKDKQKKPKLSRAERENSHKILIVGGIATVAVIGAVAGVCQKGHNSIRCTFISLRPGAGGIVIPDHRAENTVMGGN